MKKMAYGLFGGLFVLVIVLAWLAPVQASPKLQYTPFPTPTPGPDGRILYQVQQGDNLWWISSVTGVAIDELRQLNNLGGDDILIAGQYILLGLAGPAEATTAPGATGQPGTGVQMTPSPTPIMDSSAICVLLYLDVNGDAIRQGEEISFADGEVSVTERLGNYSQKGTTTYSPDPLCFEDIPPGTYNVTMAIPEGYNRTTDLSASLELVPGDTAFLNFGLQPSSAVGDDPGQGGSGGSNMLIGIIGVTLLVVGAGAGIYAATIGRSKFSEGD